MATVKTIKPNGGGDYTSLAAWWTDAKTAATADQWAECYNDGGDLGTVYLDAFDTAVPDSDHYIKIYTPLAERHDGSLDTGAYITSAGVDIGVTNEINYTQIIGIGIYGGGITILNIIVNTTGMLFDSNMLEGNVFINYATVEDSYTGSFIIRNNGIIVERGNGILLQSTGVVSGTCTMNATIYNNSIVSPTSYNVVESSVVGGNGVINITLKNNIGMGADNIAVKDFDITITNGVITSDYNMSSDDTADDYGGANNYINKTAAAAFVNQDSDLKLRYCSTAIDSGADLSGTGFDWDALHESGDSWRPQSSSWDRGAFEKELRYLILKGSTTIQGSTSLA